MEDYEALLDRAIANLPDMETTDARFVIPEPKIMVEGKTTILDNFNNIADVLNRNPDHVMKYLTREMGTAGKIDGQRAVFQGRFSKEQIKSNIEAYVEEFVMCSECGRPDTQLTKMDRIMVLKCAACGAHRPVKKRRASAPVKQDAIEEGKEYDVRIDAVGSKGDGIAKVDRYTIFVPGAAKGETLKIRIKRISGTLAFSEKV
ncbi:MAG: translation initiation factor 2 subunit 2 [Methanolobus sp.]|jgi:translation initiation factor 2 subunit 2|uniref:Translation initiation factor 2 subunit beta n=1 Tax=Methanolobus tindarius DSM 2278 TaxID=1090322 RepID=W9DQP2_METTI|nr:MULTISPECIES: translation initiation factor IF-2 subunit beta [Methanolobus]ETA67685.1 putative translation initiation factor 2 subunit beta (aeIF-2b) [Methanolobus tindarius DSM 2278]MDK2832158.1 translation initiation factor 2 subunit 2 [Methanolobus sp.]MDK2939033.1 translation initiation factor 2 subunit 2 [Methanolobus sp.]